MGQYSPEFAVAVQELRPVHKTSATLLSKPPSFHPVPPTVSPSSRSVGWPTPTGTLCPFLPQVPMPLSSFKSLPIMHTRVRSVGPLPISVAPLIGAPTLAVLHPVGLGAGEHELAVGDVHLAAAEVHRVDAVLDRGEDFLRDRACRPACRCWSCAASAHGHSFRAGRCRSGFMPISRAFWRSCM